MIIDVFEFCFLLAGVILVFLIPRGDGVSMEVVTDPDILRFYHDFIHT